MDRWTGLCFFNILHIVCSLSEFYYSVNLDKLSFQEAQMSCRYDNSFLTNIPNHEEASKILKAIEDKGNQNSSLFWIGLMKYKRDCVQDNFPLKGFHWTADNSTEFDLNKWKEKPALTCTSALCGLLSVEYSGSAVVRWGLAAKICSQKFPFICKHEDLTDKKVCPKPQITGSHDLVQSKNDPYNLRIICNSGNTFSLTCSRSTSKWSLADETEKDIAELCLDCSKGYKKNKEGTCVDVNECEPNPCIPNPCVKTKGSYICMCVDDMGNFYNVTSEKCRNLGTNVDALDKQQDKPTTPTVVMKKPVPSEADIEGSAGDMSNIIIPLIIALLILVVLIVIIAGIVKCCLMRWKQKKAMKRAAVLKETVALNGSESMGKV